MLDHGLKVASAEFAELIDEARSATGPKIFLMTPTDRCVLTSEEGFERCLRKPISQSLLLDTIVESLFGTDDASAVNGKNKLTVIESNPSTEAKSLRILLAEDNPTNQLFAQEVILRQGWRCDIANNGLEAVEAVGRVAYDVVLMDCQMPEMDGYEATREIRKQERSGLLTGYLPIIALTANALKEDRDRCLEAGMDNYLTKPFKPQALRDLLVGLFSGKRSPDQDLQTRAADSTTETQTAASIDSKQFIDCCMGDTDFAHSLLDSFSSNSLKRLEEIIAYANEQNAAAVVVPAHGLKGIAGVVAAKRLWNLAERIEQAGKANELSVIDSLLDDLRNEVESCRQCAATLEFN